MGSGLIGPGSGATFSFMTEYTYVRGRLWALAAGAGVFSAMFAFTLIGIWYSGTWKFDPAKSSLAGHIAGLTVVLSCFLFGLYVFTLATVHAANILRTDLLKLELGASGLTIQSGLLAAPLSVPWAAVLDIQPVIAPRKAQLSLFKRPNTPHHGMRLTLNEPAANAAGKLRALISLEMTGLISMKPQKIGRDIYFTWRLLDTGTDDPLAVAQTLWARSKAAKLPA